MAWGSEEERQAEGRRWRRKEAGREERCVWGTEGSRRWRSDRELSRGEGSGCSRRLGRKQRAMDVGCMSEYKCYSRKLKQGQFQSYTADLSRPLSKFNLPEISDYLLKIHSSLRWAIQSQCWSRRQEGWRINTKTGKGAGMHRKCSCVAKYYSPYAFSFAAICKYKTHARRHTALTFCSLPRIQRETQQRRGYVCICAYAIC